MSFDFSLILLIFSAITGVVWLFDVLVLKRPRMKKVQEFLAQKDVSESDFRAFLNYQLTGTRKDLSDSIQQSQENFRQNNSFSNQKTLEQALDIYHEPLIVDYAKSFFSHYFCRTNFKIFSLRAFSDSYRLDDSYAQCR